jgi:Glycine-rich domain-containing protein-like
MRDLHWTEPNYFDKEEPAVALLYAIARYHALVNFEHLGSVFTVDTDVIHSFLDLIASSPSTFCVPTLDIDLVWHTHQLIADKYGDDCIRFVKHFINQYVCSCFVF